MKIGFALSVFLVLAAQTPLLYAQERPTPLSLLDVPYISQSEALCGGAAAAMVLRYWGERGVDAASFSQLVDRSAAGIRTNVLVDELRRRGWNAIGAAGREETLRAELSAGRPVITLIEDRPGTYHYVVIVAWHERGVVFHDPARNPFRVMTPAAFENKWDAADRWMAVVTPGDRSAATADGTSTSTSTLDRTGTNSGTMNRTGTETIAAPDCDRLVADGVSAAQTNQLDVAERALTTALSCPGLSAVRELAGVRLLQRRWPEVAELASSVLAVDPQDQYTWRLLATARFVQDDRLGALEAWNKAGEPRVDLVRIEGLGRTRHAVVERLLGPGPGDLLTRAEFTRASRQLGELPAALTTRLDYVPAPGGAVELRGAVSERPLLMKSRVSWLAVAIKAAATREVALTAGSFSGGGEQVSGAWRFWPDRERVMGGVRAPAPWGGVWGIAASVEQQSFTALWPRSERTTSRVSISDWATGRIQWELDGGIGKWTDEGTFGLVGGTSRLVSHDDRFEMTASLDAWLGSTRFSTGRLSAILRSSTDTRGLIWQAAGAVDAAASGTPPDAWPAGDTGVVRQSLLRAHPLLDDGRMRSERLGRILLSSSLELQHWWRVRGVVPVAGAMFVDAGRTSRRAAGPARVDADVGVGVRAAMPGVPGMIRIDIAKGLADGATALSFVYQP